MKKSIAVVTIGSLMFASCSLNNAFLKRKYTKGIYMESIAKSKTNERKDVQHSKITANTYVSDVQQEKILSESQNTNSFTVNSKLSASVEKSKETKANSKLYHSKNTKTEAQHQNNLSLNDFNPVFNLTPLIKTQKQSANPSDEDRIIWLILALFPFLCLIGIYLHDGKKVTMNFILDLILHITFIGEIIFAILVVLDVINLA